jgi:hypothetical protein
MLRIVTSAVCLLLCAAAGILWARSYWRSDTLLGLKRNTGYGVGFVSEDGQLVAVCNAPISALWQISDWSVRSVPPTMQRRPIKSRWGFGYVFSNREMGLGIPHWSLILVSTICAVLPWRVWHFSLRALMTFTTLIALVLGAVIIAAQSM